jgi:hypothetical protein
VRLPLPLPLPLPLRTPTPTSTPNPKPKPKPNPNPTQGPWTADEPIAQPQAADTHGRCRRRGRATPPRLVPTARRAARHGAELDAVGEVRALTLILSLTLTLTLSLSLSLSLTLTLSLGPTLALTRVDALGEVRSPWRVRVRVR